MRGIVIDMEEAKLQTLVQSKAFLDGHFKFPKKGAISLSSEYSSDLATPSTDG
ncbi:MAG: hypothetical protein WAW75_00035 [Gallionella sp.]